MAYLMQNNRLTVLLANEQDGWHQTVRGLLEPQGVRTVSVRSGPEVLDVLGDQDIHVAVLDAQMPQLGGMQVVKIMHQRGKSPPAILLSEHPTNQLMQEALSLQIFSVLSKPVDFNLLLDSLARVVRRHYEGRWPM
ncbi:MAG: response regulator [Burkholderiales bacterium]|nr:response regulator [Phycisphaerae bacterium]